MFKSVLFGDINKAAYDILKDGYSMDSKTTLKTTKFGTNMSFEGKKTEGKVSGKVALDVKTCAYLNIKKLSLDSTGNAVLDVDFPNLLKCSTFMLRSQQDVMKMAPKKLSLGYKCVNQRFATDMNVDVLSATYNSSMTMVRGNVIMGLRVSGDNEKFVGSVDSAIGYRYRDAVVSLTLRDYATYLSGAVYAQPYRNVEFGATVDLPIQKGIPKIVFGFKMTPSIGEVRMKVDSTGLLSASIKKAVSKDLVLSGTASVPMDRGASGEFKMGVSMEMRV